jgi:ABC-type multidrug transport system fused ATPase/permease subunit
MDAPSALAYKAGGRPGVRGGGATVERSIYRYILRYSMRQQVLITLLSACSFPFLFMFYDVPKRIVNEAIQGTKIAFPVEIAGFSLTQTTYLFALCGVFLFLVLVNQSFKYAINVSKGLSGERMLRRLRYELYARVLRFPQPAFRKVGSGEIIQMINAEVEPLGGFIGDAFALPVFQGGTLLVIFAFVLYQNVWLALAAVAFYPIQFYVVPKLQRKVNALGKQRVRLVRSLSERIGETVAGIAEIHVHNTARFELAEFSRRLGQVFETRYRIYLWKFVIKFINNSVNHLGPFFFYSFGGYLVIKGRLELGTLVAVIAAHKDLAAPWKELLNHYQQREDARIKYEQVVEQFDPPGIMDAEKQLAEPERVMPLAGEIVAGGLRLEDDTGHVLVEGVSARIPVNERVALVGAGGSGKDALVQMLARLLAPTAGTLTVGGARLTDLPEAVTGRRMAYVGPNAHLFSASVRDNLLYGLKHRPMDTRPPGGEAGAAHARFLAEAEKAGNATDDVSADWIDYQAAGVENADAMTARVLDVLRLVDMETDVYQFGMRGTIDPAARPDLAGKILAARHRFLERLTDPALSSLVEIFDSTRYNDNATVGENLLFGRPVGNAFDLERLAEHPYVLRVLDLAGLTDTFLDAGHQVASTMVELFADLPPGHEFFERYSFISAEALPEYQALLARIARDGTGALKNDERTMLLSLPFRLSPARHRLDVIDDTFRERLLAARTLFIENLPADLAGAVERFDVERFTVAATLQENIVFGKLVYGHARGADRVRAVISEVVDALELRDSVTAVGLDFQVGIGGGRMSPAQRQKLALARSLLKRPDLLILNEATAALDAASGARVVDRLLASLKGRGIVWALHRASLAKDFDRVLVVRSGRVAEQGRFDDLNRPGSALAELIGAE